jgi:hypothetical protein
MKQSYTWDEFRGILEEGILNTPSFTIQGLARKNNTFDGILFSFDADSPTWFKIPSTLIHRVEVIDTKLCDEQWEVFIQLELQVTSGNPEAEALICIARGISKSTQPLQTRKQSRWRIRDDK